MFEWDKLMYNQPSELQLLIVLIGVFIIAMPIIVTTFVITVFKMLWKSMGGDR